MIPFFFDSSVRGGSFEPLELAPAKQIESPEQESFQAHLQRSPAAEQPSPPAEPAEEPPEETPTAVDSAAGDEQRSDTEEADSAAEESTTTAPQDEQDEQTHEEAGEIVQPVVEVLGEETIDVDSDAAAALIIVEQQHDSRTASPVLAAAAAPQAHTSAEPAALPVEEQPAVDQQPESPAAASEKPTQIQSPLEPREVEVAAPAKPTAETDDPKPEEIEPRPAEDPEGAEQVVAKPRRVAKPHRIEQSSRGGPIQFVPTRDEALSNVEEPGEKDTSGDRRSQAQRPAAQALNDSQPPDAGRAQAIPQGRLSEQLLARSGSGNNKGLELDGAQQARFVDRVARAFQTAGGRGGTVRLRLHPPELGSLKLEIRMRGGALTARLETETAPARSLLLDSLPVLRERLAEQGVRVEQFDVDLLDRQASNSPDHGLEQHRRDERGDPSSPPSTTEEDGEPTGPESAGSRLDTDNEQLNVVI